MAERWTKVEERGNPSRSLEERLRAHPELSAKMESLLAVVENASGDVEKAAEAERRVTEELRQVGNEALHGWARGQAQRKEEDVAQQPGIMEQPPPCQTASLAKIVLFLMNRSTFHGRP
ncbi:MAG TPA: hypothetical protein PLR94_12835 [Accumulibacter sp.]|uniref:hypothetical protein n=1 Tax=Accumulibacter sp. TaxID=2053492 RepID=UPI002C40ACD9|nr:hypothetical protein [Accumulibacter sp.]HNK04236.1 hypothetical protein [Accumulibacter sp.]